MALVHNNSHNRYKEGEQSTCRRTLNDRRPHGYQHKLTECTESGAQRSTVNSPRRPPCHWYTVASASHETAGTKESRQMPMDRARTRQFCSPTREKTSYKTTRPIQAHKGQPKTAACPGLPVRGQSMHWCSGPMNTTQCRGTQTQDGCTSARVARNTAAMKEHWHKRNPWRLCIVIITLSSEHKRYTKTLECWPLTDALEQVPGKTLLAWKNDDTGMCTGVHAENSADPLRTQTLPQTRKDPSTCG